MALLGLMVGGALGTLSRYAVTLALQNLVAHSSYALFPLGTLAVNVVGSFLLGLLTALGLQGLASPTLRLTLGTGFIGALTTFSTFEVEARFLVQEGLPVQGLVYILGNLLLGALAVLLGHALAAALGGRA